MQLAPPHAANLRGARAVLIAVSVNDEERAAKAFLRFIEFQPAKAPDSHVSIQARNFGLRTTILPQSGQRIWRRECHFRRPDSFKRLFFNACAAMVIAALYASGLAAWSRRERALRIAVRRSCGRARTKPAVVKLAASGYNYKR